jgi:hypothetical protein
MLNSDQKYIIECLRSSVGRIEKPDESLVEDEQQLIEIILRNSILLTVYNNLSPNLKAALKQQYNKAVKQSITQDY